MDEPAQTVNYFIAGYSVIFIGLFSYIFSLFYRWKKLKIEKKLFEE